MAVFKLPEIFESFRLATDLAISKDLIFRCRWPTSRDLIWAARYSESKGIGDTSASNIYYAGMLASTLIGMNGNPLTNYVEGKYEKLFAKEDSETSDEEHQELSELKYSEIVSSVPAVLIKQAYVSIFSPWISIQNENVGIHTLTALERELQEIEYSENFDDPNE